MQFRDHSGSDRGGYRNFAFPRDKKQISQLIFDNCTLSSSRPEEQLLFHGACSDRTPMRFPTMFTANLHGWRGGEWLASNTTSVPWSCSSTCAQHYGRYLLVFVKFQVLRRHVQQENVTFVFFAIRVLETCRIERATEICSVQRTSTICRFKLRFPSLKYSGLFRKVVSISAWLPLTSSLMKNDDQ